MTHTPAPWKIESPAIKSMAALITTNNSIIIAHIDVPLRDGEAAANARLIASAPELLEVLEKIEDSKLLLFHPLQTKIQAVIAEAKNNAHTITQKDWDALRD